MPVFLLAALDTKGPEAAFLRDRLRAAGVAVAVIDVGSAGEPAFAAEVPRAATFAAAGADLAAVAAAGDRGEAIRLSALGAARLVREAHARGEVAGLLGLGGSAGTTIAAAAARELPIGVPKLIVSTLASGQTRPYVGDKDLLLLNAVVDFAGVNRLSRRILANAAAAMAGMVRAGASAGDVAGEGGGAEADRPLVAATMFGVTTPCVQQARAILEAAGYEVLVFHATGAGGQAMESLIREGLFAGVLDLTTTELADELVGGVLSAGPDRLTAAAVSGTPQVVSVGALDMANFGPPETIPPRFRDRHFYRHNPTVTLMRTTPGENSLLGEELAKKTAASTGPAAILFPCGGVSAIDAEGKPFDDPAAREALLAAIRTHRGDVELIESPCHVNDAAFARLAAEKLLELMDLRRRG